MLVHPFHVAIGKLIKPEDFPGLGTIEIFKDNRACDPKGRPVRLRNQAAGTPVLFCDVDIVIAVGREAKVMIEIEESNVKPNHVFGKFFASAFSDCYTTTGMKKPYPPIANSTLFIQVLDSSKSKRKMVKQKQWERISESIQNVLPTFLPRKWEYRLFTWEYRDIAARPEKAEELLSIIKTFLLK